jgi:hypothetical protein
MKQRIKLSEKDLHKIIKESVLRLLENINEDIDIDPKNKGKFTATQKKSGKSTEELCHSKNPLTRKRANFAKMAKRHWKPLKEEEVNNNNVIVEKLQSDILKDINKNAISRLWAANHVRGYNDLERKHSRDYDRGYGIVGAKGMWSTNYFDKITDDMIDFVINYDDMRRKGFYVDNYDVLRDADGDARYAAKFNNGSVVVFKKDPQTIERLRELSQEAGQKYEDRENNKYHDGKDYYQWSTLQRGRAFDGWKNTGLKHWDNPEWVKATGANIGDNWRKDSWVKQNMDDALASYKK